MQPLNNTKSLVSKLIPMEMKGKQRPRFNSKTGVAYMKTGYQEWKRELRLRFGSIDFDIRPLFA